MAQPFLDQLCFIVEGMENLHIGANIEDVDCRHFFSGAAAFMRGQIFMSLTPVGLALKLPQAQCELLISQGGQALRYFPKAPIKKNYAIMPQEIVSDKTKLEQWIASSIKFVLTKK